MFSATIISNILFYSSISIMYMFYLSIFHYSSWMFLSFFLMHSFFSLHLSVWQVYRCILKLIDSLFISVQSSHEPMKNIFHFCYSVVFFLFLPLSFYFLLVFVSLLILPTLNVVYFSIRFLNMLIIGIISSLSDNFKICIIYESGSDVSFAPSDFFFLPFNIPCDFFLSKFRYDILGRNWVGTQVYQPLGWGLC